MSFSLQAFQKKLSVLQDTQESIVSLSQWVLFHHRHSKETAEIWSQFVLSQASDSLQMRLSLFHLCNDVVQRARRKDNTLLIVDFAGVLPPVFKAVYASFDGSTRPKIDRLLAVWDERAVFPPSDISNMKAAIASSGLAKPKAVSNSVMSHIAPELAQLNELFIKASQLGKTSEANLTQFNVQAKTYLPEDVTSTDSLPAPKAYLGKLSMLENFSQVSIANIRDLQSIKQQIADQLNSLASTISDGILVDNNTVDSINHRLIKLESTRAELQELLGERKEQSRSLKGAPVIAPPVYHESDDDCIPTYDNDENESNSDSEEIEDGRTAENGVEASSTKQPDTDASVSFIARKRCLSPLQTSNKRVAFSEDVQVKEFDVEEELCEDEDQEEQTIATFPSSDSGDQSTYASVGQDNDMNNGFADSNGASADIMDLLSKLT